MSEVAIIPGRTYTCAGLDRMTFKVLEVLDEGLNVLWWGEADNWDILFFNDNNWHTTMVEVVA